MKHKIKPTYNMQNQRFQKMLYWAELFQKEYVVKPNKLRGARLLIIYTSFMAEFGNRFKSAEDADKPVLRSIASYVPSTPELIALFMRIDGVVSTRLLSRYSPEVRTELVRLRDKNAFIEAKKRHEQSLDRVVSILKSV